MQRFIESLHSGKLATNKCLLCRHLIWPPSDVCPRCLSKDTLWEEIGGIGKLIAFSESFLMDQPCIVGMVELNENIRLLARIICYDTAQLKMGISVRMIKCGIQNNQPYYEFQPI